MQGLVIGFVIYKPDICFWERLIFLTENSICCMVYDNSPDCDNHKEMVLHSPQISYMTAGKNLGLGIGISSICAKAYYSSYETLLFFDQDTLFDLDSVNFIESYYKENKQALNNYGLVVFNSKRKSPEKGYFRNVSLAISSGSLFILSNVHKIGWHNENYFVDCVDYEFCYRSYRNKFKIGEFSNTPNFDHVTGQEDSDYKFLGYRFRSRKYQLKRIYDTFTASVKLGVTCVVDGSFRFSGIIFRSLVIYLTFQFLSRVGKEIKNGQ